MKNLLLISALGALIAGCDPGPAAETALTNSAPANASLTNGSGNIATENASATDVTNGTPVASESTSNAPSDAQREIEASQAGQTASGSPSADGSVKPKNGEEVAVMETAQGRVVLMFLPNKAPKHVENFKKLARKGFYDGTAFHRVIPGFMVQGGDPNSDPKRAAGPPGTGGPGYSVKAEFNDTPHVRGVLSAARSQDPDSAGSQFFICVARAESLDNQYTAYGRVVSGMEAVDKIVGLPTDMNDMPTAIDQARVKSVRIVKWPVK